ncbi:hypothetical protein J532_3372, partial [Acinetobacter baumannii 940793]
MTDDATRTSNYSAAASTTSTKVQALVLEIGRLSLMVT